LIETIETTCFAASAIRLFSCLKIGKYLLGFGNKGELYMLEVKDGGYIYIFYIYI
jgi:hypothetical protein